MAQTIAVCRLCSLAAQEYLDSLAHDGNGDPTLEREIAFVYEKVGDVQGGPNRPNLGRHRGGGEELSKGARSLSQPGCLGARQQRYPAQPGGEPWAHLLYQVNGDATKALQNCRQEFALREELSKAQADNAILKRELAISYENLGGALKIVGDFTAAKNTLLRELEIFKTLADADPADLRARRNLCAAYSRMGAISGLLRDTPPLIVIFDSRWSLILHS